MANPIPLYDGTCPRCGEEGTFLMKLEANELGPDDPHVEMRVFECWPCDFSWEVERTPRLYEWDPETGRVTRKRIPGAE